MNIINRRNAVVGWLTLKAAKMVARRWAKRLTKLRSLRRPQWSAVSFFMLAGLAVAMVVLRRRAHGSHAADLAE